MIQAVRVTYDGKNFVPDENVNLEVGQDAIVTILSDDVENVSKKIDYAKFAGSAGKLFKSTEEIDNYIRSLRNEERF